MPAAPDSLHPAASASSSQRQEPVLSPAKAQAGSPLPASIAGAFAAAAYSMQHSLENESRFAEEEDKDAGLLPQLYASRIGPRAQAYYLAQFKRFDALDRSLPSWNMAAAFFTLAWCCLRGLWQEAAKYLADVTAVALIWWFGLRPAMPAAMSLGLGVALWLAAMAVPGLLGNGWYWRKVRQQTLQAITDSPNMAQVHSVLQAQAAPAHQKLAALLVLALPLAAAAGAGLALLPGKATAPAVVPAMAPIAAPAVTPAATQAVAAPTQPAPAVTAAPVTPVAETTAETATEAAPASTQPSSGQAAPTAAPAATNAVAESPAASSASDLQPGKFYLNLGAFSNPEEAAQAVAQLEKARLPVMRQNLPSNKGEVTRLRSGPFDSRKRAEKAMRKLQGSGMEPGLFQADKGKSAP